MEGFAGKAFVVRVDEATAFARQTTFFDDLDLPHAARACTPSSSRRPRERAARSCAL